MAAGNFRLHLEAGNASRLANSSIMNDFSDPLARALRYFKILLTIANRPDGKCLGREHLAAACGCDIKTIGRDLRSLKTSGIFVEYDRVERTYVLPDKGVSVLAATLTHTEVMALALVRGLLASSPHFPMASEVESAIETVTAGLPPGFRRTLDAAAQALNAVQPAVRDYSQAPVQPLLMAHRTLETVEILYNSRSSGKCERRLVDPYRLDQREGRYLEIQAWCHNNKTVRTFALDRVLDVRQTGRNFVMRAWDDSDAGVVGGLRGGKLVNIEIRFDPVVAPFARDRRWPFAAVFTEPDPPDGSVVLQGQTQGVEGIVRELLSWRRHVTVLGGPELRTRMIEEIHAIAALYPAP